MFVVNYMQQMSVLGGQLERLIKHDNIVNRVFSGFIECDDIDDESKVCFVQFNTSKNIIRNPELLFDLELVNDFLNICPLEWSTQLRTEFELYSPHEWRYLDLLGEFRDRAFNNLTLTDGYALFCTEIIQISTRIIRLLHEVYFSINRN